MAALDVHVVAPSGDVGPWVLAYARQKVARVAKLAPGPVLFARVKLGRAPDPGMARPAIAQAVLDVDGRPVRAQVAARQLDEAVDLLEERLRDRLGHLASHLRARRHASGVAEPGEWRHGDLPARRPAYFPRPVQERRLVRRKQLTLRAMTVDEAVLDLELLDYDFHLFTELDTGRDAVLWRQPGGAHGLAVAGGHVPDLDRCAAPVRPGPAPPVVTIEGAMRRLDLSGEPFVFFVDAGTGRGGVAYRRYDGHYGLLAPASAAPSGSDQPATREGRA